MVTPCQFSGCRLSFSRILALALGSRRTCSKHNGLLGKYAGAVQHQTVGAGIRALEYFTGSGHLAQALTRKGCLCLCLEAFPKDAGYDITADLDVNTFLKKELNEITLGGVNYFHAGTPCSL